MYWEDVPGRRRAPYLDLCLETIRRHADGMSVTVLDEHTVHDLVELDPDRWGKLPDPRRRSDYVRTRLLHQYGGLWMDIDTIAMGPLTDLLSYLEQHAVVGFGRELEGRFYTGLVASRPGSPFVEAWMNAQDEMVDKGCPTFAALAQDITRRLPEDLAGVWPIQKVSPVPWYEWRRFGSRIDSPASVLSADPSTVVLWNEAMAPRFGQLSRRQVLSAGSLLGRLFRIALGESSLGDEMDLWTRFSPLNRLRFSHVGRSIEFRLRASELRHAESAL